MTIKMPPKTFSDWILCLFGKKQAIKIPDGVYENFGQHVYAKARRENSWRALFRPNGRTIPPGFVHIDEYYEKK